MNEIFTAIYGLHMMAFSPEHLKGHQNPKYIPLSDKTSVRMFISDEVCNSKARIGTEHRSGSCCKMIQLPKNLIEWKSSFLVD